MKPALLFLCHRIPYPPNKGDKIRSFHLLRYLAAHYRIYLASFVDDEEDWQYTPKVEELCEETCFRRLEPRWAKLKSLRGLLQGEALSIPYYADSMLADWIDQRVNTGDVERVIVYSSAMAQYVAVNPGPFRRKVIDFVDVDSDKWQQYAERKPWPMNWIYRREARRLLAYDQQMARLFDASLFVSSAEAALFRQLAPKSAQKIGYYNNGVDTDYFAPELSHANPYPEQARALVFTGAMDYWPNVDAVVWFARTVFPQIREDSPECVFYVVGSNPSEDVSELKKLDGVVVTGRVEDVRPYIHHALAAVAPMRVARGVQNKVLEAMAMARPVLVSPQGLEGIVAEDKREVLLCKDARDYVLAVQALMERSSDEIGYAARARVQADFNWESTLPPVRDLLESGR